MSASKIEWTEMTWNPTTGCDRISPGCDHCYAMTMARRLKAMGAAKYQNDGDPRTSGPGFGVTMHQESVLEPIFKWPRKSRVVFLDSMSDVFHARVDANFHGQLFATMALTPQHSYQVLTKRPGRVRDLLAEGGRVQSAMMDSLWRLRRDSTSMPAWNIRWLFERTDDGCPWPLPNVWLGTSIEADEYAWRANDLRDTPAAVRFLSLEPLLGSLPSLDLGGIDWVITGGESGPGARPMDPQWARIIRDLCQAKGVAFLHKQNGEWATTGEFGAGSLDGPRVYGSATQVGPHGFVLHEVLERVGKKAAGRELDGRTWDEFPVPFGRSDSA
ncbi:MAG: phage Gp37/Gp68 family protein [Mycobacterium sp.]|nr:phage Gp37/Gp68 family protein [Mycobacterium sp.]